jgi:hypothetical protein
MGVAGVDMGNTCTAGSEGPSMVAVASCSLLDMLVRHMAPQLPADLLDMLVRHMAPQLPADLLDMLVHHMAPQLPADLLDMLVRHMAPQLPADHNSSLAVDTLVMGMDFVPLWRRGETWRRLLEIAPHRQTYQDELLRPGSGLQNLPDSELPHLGGMSWNPQPPAPLLLLHGQHFQAS